MGADQWIALAALILTGFGMAGGIVYRMGQLNARVSGLAEDVRDLAAWLQRLQDRQDRRKLN